MSKIIGLTGGIGSGKTTVAKMFQSAGFPVYIADDEAKKILELPETIEKIKEKFGDEIISEGKIDKKKLSNLVFTNPEQLQNLNSIVHPLVKIRFNDWVTKNKKFPFIVKETAILFESGSYKECNIIITVTASQETRIERVMRRDNVTKEEVLQRINNQWKEEDKIKMSDFVINNENLEVTRLEFDEILKKINKI